MCLAVPGKILSVNEGDQPMGRIGVVDFQGNRAETSLVLTPEASVGDWVLVHAGFALQTLDEADALETWKYLQACYPEDAFQPRGPDAP